jgi:hypothetical protein
MADLQILAPTLTTRPAFSFRARLENATYGFRIVWNARLHFWSLDVRDQAGGVMMRGIRISTGLDLLAPLRSVAGAPPGQLFVVDDSGAGREVDRTGWRSDFRLIYRSAADVEAAEGTADAIH